MTINISVRKRWNALSAQTMQPTKNGKKQNAKSLAGWVMVGIGGACAIGSLACIPAGGIAVGSMCAGGLVFSSVGLGLALGSAKNYDQAIDIYNAQFDTATELHIFADPNGVGIALRF